MDEVKVRGKEIEKKFYDEPELVSSCCGVGVRDLAGDGVGGVDICPACGEWAGIVDLNDENV